MFEKILVPLDGSALAETILPQVEDLARTQKAHITLLTVGNTSGVAVIAEAGTTIMTEFFAALRRAAETNLIGITNTLKAKGLKVSWVYREGVPARDIIRYVDEAQCDLIAMATHGRGEIAWVLGSVAEQVVSHATVPVLLMRVLKGQPLMKKEDLFSGP